MTRVVLAGLPLIVGVLTAGCGTIGPPMAPEDIGLAARIRADQEKEEKAANAQSKPKVEEEEATPEGELAPLYPIGTR
jgi:hypothetical protein